MKTRNFLAASGLFALGVFCSPAILAATQANYYVSPTGNDSTGTGTLSAPWATMGKARDYIRTNSLNANMTG
ncbi:MAG TPA: hypothetical protein VGH90_04335, partial [Chthoniobacteraceae bacterium]